jgi:ubiquitin C-terminal hydrolase
MFHLLPTNGTVEYSSILSLNKHQYALLSVSCFNGGHWWSYGRDMPVGSNWYTLNDQLISNHGPKQFPLSSNMRLLIYYRIEN